MPFGTFRATALPLALLAIWISPWQRPAALPMPRLVLWAWERPEDLRFIDPATTGVAYLAATVDLQPDGTARVHARQQPLRVPSDTSRAAVVRIESPPRYQFADPASLATILAGIAQQPDIQALQIDYDARASERNFYRDLLADLRTRTTLPIGITALASWCAGDAWLQGQPLSDAVPMFFRMGFRESKSMAVESRECTHSIGLSTDESWPEHRPIGLHPDARIYVFNPHPWTSADYDRVVRRVKEWK